MKANSRLLSIIIPTFNRSVLLIEAVNSVLRQNYQEFEIVIVDDGSSENTISEFFNFLQSLTPDESAKIKFLTQQKSGAPTARNYGLQSCTGDFVIFMDSDDLLTKDGVTRGIAELEASGADYVHLLVQKCDSVGNLIAGSMVGGAFRNSSLVITGMHWQTMGAIYRRRVVELVGQWNTELTGSQDWEYQARVKMSGAEGFFVESIIGYWRNHEEGRIGTSHYNHQYVRSVEKACVSIGTKAAECGLLDGVLRRRLLRRVLIHAIEAGSAYASEDRHRLLATARSFASVTGKLLIGLVDLVEIPALDRVMFKIAKFKHTT